MRTLLALAALALAPPLRAQEPPQPSDPVAQAFQTWRERHGDAWRLRVNPATATAQFLWGGSAPAPLPPVADADYVELARAAFEEAAGMFGLEGSTLVRPAVRRLPLSRVGSTDKVVVEFAQELRGIPVVRGGASALFGPGGALLSLDSTGLPGLESVPAAPALDAFSAVAAAHRAYIGLEGREATEFGTPELVVYPWQPGKAAVARLAWAVELHTPFQDGTLPSGRRLYVAADLPGGEILGGDDLVHECGFAHSRPPAGPNDLQGNVQSWATPGVLPDTPANPETLQPMRYLQVTSPAGNDVTDAAGNFVIPYSGTTSVNLTFAYSGPYARVQNSAGAEYSLTQPFAPGVPGTAVMNPALSAQVTAEANAFDSVIDLLSWIWDTNPADNTMAFQVLANVNISSTCNAFFNGSSINFYLAGGGCVNTAYSTVVAHEEGHWANVRYGSGNGADGFGEGNADVYAMYVYDSPIVGQDFCGTGCHIRTGNNTRQWCGSGCYGQVHTDGEVLMGALWKVRRNLNTTLGNAAGDATANALHNAWMNAYNDGQILPIIEEHWLALDDNDGNIYNGTPNYADIDSAFREQGFPGVDLRLIDIAHVPLGNTQNEVGPYVVDAQISSLIGATITGADVKYRVNGGPEQTVPMTHLGGADWRGAIPGQLSVARVEYHIEARDSALNSARLPRDDEFEFWVGVFSRIYFNDFEGATDEGWTHAQVATQDDWQRGTPAGKSGSSGGVSWSDPSSAYSGARNWGNDLGPAGWNGAYQPNVNNHLDSPPIDCTGKTGVQLRFRRWLTVEESRYDAARVLAWRGGAWNQVWVNPIAGHTLDSDWSLQQLDISAWADNNPALQIRFELVTDGGLELGGWNIDDFEVYSVEPVPGGTDTILLTGSTSGQVGGRVSYDIANAPPLAPWWLYYSPNLNGTVINGQPFDIGTPYFTAATGVTDAAGAAAWTSPPIPPKGAGRTLYVEARADGARTYDSNVVALQIQ